MFKINRKTEKKISRKTGAFVETSFAARYSYKHSQAKKKIHQSPHTVCHCNNNNNIDTFKCTYCRFGISLSFSVESLLKSFKLQLLFYCGAIFLSSMMKFNFWYLPFGIHRWTRRRIRVELINIHCRVFWYIR